MRRLWRWSASCASVGLRALVLTSSPRRSNSSMQWYSKEIALVVGPGENVG